MKTVWFNGMSQAEQEIFVVQLSQSKKVLDKLSEIVYNMLRERQTVNRPDYESASWPYLQAHNNGAAEMARAIIDIVDIKLPKT